MQSWTLEYDHADDIPDDLLPESFDLTNIGGFDFTSDVVDQGGCGSCYIVSFTQVVESRLKTKYGEQPTRVSPQQVLSCNYMTEGCDGGWAFGAGLFAENGHLVSEDCAPYAAKTKDEPCSKFSTCPAVAQVNRSYFIGGAYGESSESKMMKDLLRNGMINSELLVPSAFMTYSEGILSEDGMQEMHNFLQLRQNEDS